MSDPAPNDWPPRTGRILLDETDSTNAEGLRRARAGVAAPFWLLALSQTQARGRRGRAWAMPEGNFAASLVMPAPPPAEAALRGFVAGLALLDALASLGVVRARLALKWPNDLLLDGGKLAGILLESDGAHLVLGMGVNLAAAPPPACLEPGALPAADLGGTIRPVQLLDRLVPAMDRLEAELVRDGFNPIRRRWLDRAAGLDRMVTARMAQTRMQGRFVTIDETGALVLDTDHGHQQITAADIHFG